MTFLILFNATRILIIVPTEIIMVKNTLTDVNVVIDNEWCMFSILHIFLSEKKVKFILFQVYIFNLKIKCIYYNELFTFLFLCQQLLMHRLCFIVQIYGY